MCAKDPLQFTQATLFAYKQPFKTTMQFKHYQLRYREGLILKLVDNNAQLYFTEIAPLPGFSQETLLEVTQELIHLLSSGLENLTQHTSQFNSLQFAVDSLTIDHHVLVKQGITDTIPLLQGSCALICSQYQELGLPPLVKLKVARGSITTDINNFQALCQLNPQVKIRCDANQAWSKEQAAQFFATINPLQLDYIEEPTQSHQTNVKLAEQYSIFLGLDETLQQANYKFQAHPRIKAFVIKPTLIGSKEKIDQLVSIAIQHAIQVNFSSSFETIVGLTKIEKLAYSYQLQHAKTGLMVSLGIDTLKYFDNSLLLQDICHIEKECQQLEVLWTSN